MKNKKGFTLVELIIVITVLVVVMGGVSLLMRQMAVAAENQRQDRVLRAVEEQARMAMLTIVRDARLSHNAVYVPDTSLTLTARHPFLPAGANEVIITYTWDLISAIGVDEDFYDAGDRLLQRTVRVGGVDLGIGELSANLWPNSFASVTIQDLEVATVVDPPPLPPLVRRLNLQLTFDRDGDDVVLNSAASLNRMPSPAP